MIGDNMLPPKDTITAAIHMRCWTAAGNKDWIGVISTNPMYSRGIYVVFGKTSEVMNDGGQGRVTKNLPTIVQLNKLAVEKQNKGYKIIDTFDINRGDDWQSVIELFNNPPNPIELPDPEPESIPEPIHIIPPNLVLSDYDSTEEVEEWEWTW